MTPLLVKQPFKIDLLPRMDAHRVLSRSQTNSLFLRFAFKIEGAILLLEFFIYFLKDYKSQDQIKLLQKVQFIKYTIIQQMNKQNLLLSSKIK